MLEPCGSWQERQSPSMTGGWFDPLWVGVPIAGVAGPLQSFTPEALSSFLSSEACGVWQAVQSPSSTGLWV